MAFDPNTLAEAYLRHRDEDFWAWQEVHETVVAGGDVDRAWQITMLLLKKAETDDALGYVAAGPLEDMIDVYGHAALDRIEPVADNDRRIQIALNQVGVLYYYEEFERWYNLLHKYGLRSERVAGAGPVVGSIMGYMDSYVNDRINVYEYGRRITELLDKPLDDKAAQRILQQACCDFELLDAKRPPDYRELYLTKPELKIKVMQMLIELKSLGYEATSES